MYNNFENQIKLVFIFGSVLLFINWILAASFCGIYTNSSGNVILNVFISILFSVLFYLILNIASTLIKYFIGSKCKILSEIYNCKLLVDVSFNECCCYFSYLLCCFNCCCWRYCDCCKEEFVKEDEEEKKNKINNNNN